MLMSLHLMLVLVKFEFLLAKLQLLQKSSLPLVNEVLVDTLFLLCLPSNDGVSFSFFFCSSSKSNGHSSSKTDGHLSSKSNGHSSSDPKNEAACVPLYKEPDKELEGESKDLSSITLSLPLRNKVFQKVYIQRFVPLHL